MEIAQKDKVKLLLKFGPGRLFVQTLDEHYKFYHINTQGKKVVATYGRIGKTQQNDIKDFYSERQAEHYVNQKIAEKLRKGYIEMIDAVGVK
jgi:predicted DNA-binding WGR domain protein